MEQTADVVVLGAGVIGCAIAHELAHRGQRVVVVDRRAPGGGASQASAGVLAPHVEAEVDTPLEALGVASLALYDDFIARVRAGSGADIPYARSGAIEVATDEAGASRLEQRAQALAARGVACTLVDGARARELEPRLGPVVRAGLFIESHGAVLVRALVSALVTAGARQGVTFESNVDVARIDARGDGAEVEGSGSRWRAPVAVVAAGAWASQLQIDGVPSLPVAPVRGQLLALRASAVATHVIWAPDCYLVPWPDGTMLVGATVEHAGFVEDLTLGGLRQLSVAACRVLPALDGSAIESLRVGLRPGSPDGLPIVGRASHAAPIVLAAGHYRNGVLLAPWTARAVADIITGRPPDPLLGAASPRRFGL
jgi:glycine oxidase